MHVLRPGDGLFETIKVDDGRPFALDRHLARIAGSARELGFPPADRADLSDRVVSAAGSWEGAGRIRLTLTLAPSGDLEVGLALTPRAPAAPSAHVVTSPWRRNQRGAWAGHKATAYVDDVVALADARRLGADEAVLADLDGNACEGTTSNLFYVVDGELRTPPLRTGCLPGITRALVLEWGGVREVAEPISVVEQADEVFLTSTTRDVQSVRRWGSRELSLGPVTQEMQRRWAETFAREFPEDRT